MKILNRVTAIMLGTAMLFSVAGCGSDKVLEGTGEKSITADESAAEETAAEETTTEETAEEITKEEATVEEETVAEEETTEEAAAEETVAEEETTEETTADKTTDDSEISVAETDIEGNGGYFVRIGGDIYYRVMGDKAIDSPAVWGNFISNAIYDAEDESVYTSEIKKMNIATGEIETFSTDYGLGGLYTDGSYIYFTEHEGSSDTNVKYISLTGDDTGILAEGDIVGCDAESGLIAVSSYEMDPYVSIMSLYKGKDLVAQYKSEDGVIYAGITGDGLYLMTPDYEEAYATYYQLSPESEEPICLGASEAFESGSPNHEQFLSAADGVYFVLTGIEGTMNLEAGVQILKALPGEADSLKSQEIPERFTSEEYGETRSPELYLDETGTVQYADVAPNTALLGSLEEGGDLMFTYKPDEYEIIKEAYRIAGPDAAEDSELYFQQTAEYIGGNIYLIVAKAHRTPDSDIGWRMSYGVDEIEYLRINPDSGEETDMGRVEY